MSEWQDIETAPKDGTNILAVWSKKREVYAVIWWESGNWHEYDYDTDVEGMTHWMPLPEPPLASSETE